MRRLYVIILLCISICGYSRPVKRVAAFGVTVPKYEVHGIDVSRYQEAIDWEQLAQLRSGKDSVSITFAFVKATEGKTLQDKYFVRNWSGTRKNNIIRGAYHYYKPNVPSKHQYQNFKKTVKIEKGDLPPVLDIEEVGKLGADNMKKGIINWLTLIEKHYGVKPIIYTNYHFYNKHLSGKEFEGYKFWIAHYSKDLSKDDEWVFWQYSEKGVINNINSKVALNALNGTIDDLKQLCKQ